MMDRLCLKNMIVVLGLSTPSLLAVAQPILKPELTVVYDSGNTIDVTPYYGARLRSSDTSLNDADVPPAPDKPQRTTSLADTLPLVSQRLSPGQLEVREVDGITEPFFIMGMDRQSIVWLQDAATALVDMNATGFVVQADNRADWEQLKAFAREQGIPLSLLNGDGIAQKYGLKTYPSVITGERPNNEQ